MHDTIHLTLCPENIAAGNNGLLKHQEDTVNALRQYSIVLNCAMTGAGKTKSAHLSIQKHAAEKPVLFIAPTNALVSQHLEDAREFVKRNGLPHQVAAVDGETLFYLQKRRNSIFRSSEALHQLIYNPREFSSELGIDPGYGPLWLITNPDQVWLSIVKGRHQDTRNLLKDFIDKFRFVVVDEFHYYTAEQLVLFFLSMAFWKHFGQFDDGLKMLLLTATPAETVQNFFHRMEMDFGIVGNDFDENTPSIPVLSPVELTLTTGSVHDFADDVMKWYQEGKDGVVISDSLMDINKAQKYYEQFGISVGRITGPIRNEQRKKQSQKRLILATPTVDLGYNFIKPDPKDRQEIDFLLSCARTKSRFWQRLGRAGRVLGRKETQIPSQAIILLPDSACCRRLADFDGQTITRQFLKESLDISDKELKEHALTREGLFTATRQLVEIENKMLPDEKKYVAEKIFLTLRECFDPKHLGYEWDSYKKRHGLSKQLERVNEKYPDIKPFYISQFLKFTDTGSDPMNTLLSAWAKNWFYRTGKLELYNEYRKENSVTSIVQSLLKQKPSLKKEIVEYHKEQMLRLNYLFNFRGSGIQKEVWVYDPDLLHSEQQISKMDLLYLLSKYETGVPLTHSQAETQWKRKLPNADFFIEIKDFYEYPYVPVFRYNGRLPERPVKPEDAEEPELLPCFWQTVALHNLSIEFENKKIGFLPVPPVLKEKLTGISELFYITPMENRFQLSNWLKEYEVQTGTLKAQTEIGTYEPHSVVYGKDAIFISEELYFRKKNTSC
ncbi:MAG: type I-D CRISPR-associated helicase Cas3' [Desulfobacterales bacterium]